MAQKDLSKLSEEELVEYNNQLSEKRAAAETEIKAQQLDVQAEISKRQRRRKLETLTADERAELAAMAAEDTENG